SACDLVDRGIEGGAGRDIVGWVIRCKVGHLEPAKAVESQQASLGIGGGVIVRELFEASQRDYRPDPSREESSDPFLNRRTCLSRVVTSTLAKHGVSAERPLRNCEHLRYRPRQDWRLFGLLEGVAHGAPQPMRSGSD